MGCFMSAEEKELKRKNDDIDNALKKEKANLRNEVKMLLLGTVWDGCSPQYLGLTTFTFIRCR